jgi:DNA-binding transcriptional regulator PaaX
MKHLRKNSLAAILLKAVAMGGIFTAVLIAPNLPLALAPFLKKEDWRAIRKAERRRIHEEIKRLHQRRLLDIEVKNGKEYLKITEKGRTTLKEFNFELLALPKLKNWDKKWRLVMFDIPEGKRRARQSLQAKLVSLGFYPLQRSVFAYPYPCEDEVDFLKKFLDVEHLIIYCETASLGVNEIKVRRHFGLL